MDIFKKSFYHIFIIKLKNYVIKVYVYFCMLVALKTNYFLKYFKATVHHILIFMNVNKLALHRFPELSTKI